jgi:alginate production protein
VLLGGLLVCGLRVNAETVGRDEVERDPVPVRPPLISEDQPSAAFDIDAPPPTRNPITETLSFSTRFEVEFERREGYDLAHRVPDDLLLFKPEARLAFAFRPTRRFQAFLNLILERDFALEEEGRSTNRPTVLEVDQAHFTFRELAPGTALRLGRQRFRDSREWYYDDELDGARFFFGRGPFALEASLSRFRPFDQDLLNQQSNPRINNYFLTGRYRADADHELQGFLLLRDDLTLRQGRPIFIGARADGKIAEMLSYGLDLAYLTGLDDFNRARQGNPDLRAWGVDTRLTVEPNLFLSPSLSLGAAFGSGDREPRDGTGRAFRQTGLQDNTGRFNGVTTFQYYGEIFDPELSNMAILTAGLGLKPTGRSSIDLVYHHYRQHRATAGLRRSDLRARPTGRDVNLGDELDLVIGGRDIPNTDIEIVFGWFRPGAAFGATADDAFLARFELVYRY